MASVPCTVLIVDDHDDARTLYAESLAEAGFRVLSARDGKEAVAIAIAERPDAIVMDLMMPEVDGWDAVRAIRAQLGRRPHMVAVSAYSGDASRALAFDGGFDDFISKPAEPSVIRDVVQAVLRARRASAPTE